MAMTTTKIVDALLLAGAPDWVRNPGWVDEHGWGLIAPVVQG